MAKKAQVKDYMIKNVDYLNYRMTVKEAIEFFIKSGHEKFPVVKKGNLVGVITVRDLLNNYKTPDKQVKDILPGKVVVATPDLYLDDVARILFRHGFNKLPVVNSGGKLVGIIANTDILRSHIERATPQKVDMVKNLIESEHKLNVNVRRYVVPVDKLHPTQGRVYADELEGREYELKKGLAEPLIVVKKRGYFVLVDGHHRAVAALHLRILELMAHVLELDEDMELGMEKAARGKNLINLHDIKVIDNAQHPLVEITTKKIKKKDLE